MTSRSDCEPLPKPTLSPSFALARPGTFLRVGFFTAAVWCVPALRVPLVHSLINHFRQNLVLCAACCIISVLTQWGATLVIDLREQLSLNRECGIRVG